VQWETLYKAFEMAFLTRLYLGTYLLPADFTQERVAESLKMLDADRSARLPLYAGVMPPKQPKR
jgi:hypothetical protein